MLQASNDQRVQLGNNSALISVFCYADITTGMHCSVSLDFGSTAPAPAASAEAHAIIVGLFPEYAPSKE